MNTNYRSYHGYRTEEVGLRPRGNTVTVDVEAENPFEDELAGAPVTVATQASGGVAKAPPRQQSRKVMYKGKKPALPAGAVKAAVARKNAGAPARIMHRGFMPGMGDLSGPFAGGRARKLVQAMARGPVAGLNRVAKAAPVKPGGGINRVMRRRFLRGLDGLAGIPQRKVYAVAPRRQMRGFMPGMGEFGDLGVTEGEYQRALIVLKRPTIKPEDQAANEEAQITIATYNAEKDKQSSSDRSSALAVALEKGAQIFATDQQRRAAAASASADKKRADAEARIAEAKSDSERSNARIALARVNAEAEATQAKIAAETSTSKTKSSNTKWFVGGGIALAAVVVIGIALAARSRRA
jgi:hypothetical protein